MGLCGLSGIIQTPLSSSNLISSLPKLPNSSRNVLNSVKRLLIWKKRDGMMYSVFINFKTESLIDGRHELVPNWVIKQGQRRIGPSFQR